jgi:hypothetical protein
MYLMAGLLVVALFCNLAVKAVDPRHHYRSEAGAEAAAAAGPAIPASESRYFHAMDTSKPHPIRLVVYWSIVGIPLAWGIWKTILKLPALFQ